MKAKKIQRKHGLDLVVVDYLQLAGAGERYQGQRVNEVSQLTAAFKGLAKELNVPVILLSQLSRAVESRESHRPKLSDLRDSGSIEQDADIVGFVYRHEYYLARSDKPIAPDKLEKHLAMLEDFKGKAELIIDKSRNGPTGTVPLYFDGGKTLFRGVAQ
jgi:replicative DNA helicase